MERLRTGNAILDVVVRVVVIALITAIVVWILRVLNAPQIVGTIIWILALLLIAAVLFPLVLQGASQGQERAPRTGSDPTVPNPRGPAEDPTLSTHRAPGNEGSSSSGPTPPAA
jgi:hypothetical protein